MRDIIYAKHSHYEIPNYYMGDCPSLEDNLTMSSMISFGRRKFLKKESYYHYDDDTHILYVPRGYDPVILAQETGRYVKTDSSCNEPVKCIYSIETQPLNDFQREAIRFLSGVEEYLWTEKHSQLVLSIPTRSGKTYCTITAGAILAKKILVIVKTVDLRSQWKDDILKYTQLTSDNIEIIDSSAKMDRLANMPERKLANHCIYLVNIQTMHSYIKRNGFQATNDVIRTLGIGIKVFDEAHKEFKNILLIDYALNVWKTFYITATFGRSDHAENSIFNRCFDQVAIMKKRDVTKRKHTHYIAFAYHAYVDEMAMSEIFKGTTFNRFRYIENEIESGVIVSMVQQIIETFIVQKKLEGKILILSSSKSSCDFFYELMIDILPMYSVCVHYEGNKKEDFREYGIICATPQMLGTGMTIPHLRIIINTEPTSSKVNVVQYFGRLAEYAPDLDTYYIELFNKAFSKMVKWYRIRKNALKLLAKSILLVDNTIIKNKKKE